MQQKNARKTEEQKSRGFCFEIAVVPEVMTRSGTGSHDRKWYQKTWPEVVAEAITYVQKVIPRSGIGSHDRKSLPEVVPAGSGTGRKWYRKSYPEGVPEVITGSGTGSHDQKWYRKSWSEVVPEDMTQSGIRNHGQIRYGHDEFIANHQTDRQTDRVLYNRKHPMLYKWDQPVADISSNTSLPGLSSGNCFDTVRSQTEPRTR